MTDAYASLTGPVWVGEYAYFASDITGGSQFARRLLPVGVVARHLLEAGRGRLVVPEQVACPPGFALGAGQVGWALDLPNEAIVDGFEARASAMVNGVEVNVLEAWGERARVREVASHGSGQWIGLEQLRRVVVDQTALVSWRFDQGRTGGGARALRSYRFRRVFPVGFDAWSSPERIGGVSVDQWSSHWASPVPASGTTVMIVGGKPFPDAPVSPKDPVPEGPASFVALDSWCQVPVGVGVRRPWQGGLYGAHIVDRDAEGFVSAGAVRARWGGREVEVVYVAYAYAYVREVDQSRPWRQVPRPRSLGDFDAWEGPVRLDELEDVRFTVYVRRHPESGSWSFLEAWGLPGDFEGSAEARLERGFWPAWPVTHQLGPILP